MTSFRPLAVTGGITAALLLAALYFYFDPAGSVWFPKCPFLVVTGLQCPGCGSQRAIHALLHGDITTAWHTNALFILELPLILFLFLAWGLRHRYPSLRRLLSARPFILTLLTLIVLWTIVRNIVHI